MLIVIAVIGILAAVGTIGYRGVTDRANNTKTQSNLSKAQDFLETTDYTNSLYPTSLSGFTADAGVTLTYRPSTDRKTYCLGAASTKAGAKSYKVSQEGSVSEGTCPPGTYSGPAPASITACAIPSGGYNIGWPTSPLAVSSHLYIAEDHIGNEVDEIISPYNTNLYVYDLGQGGGGGSVQATVEYIDSNGYYSASRVVTVSFGGADCYD